MLATHTTVLADSVSGLGFGLAIFLTLIALAYVVFIVAAFVSIIFSNIDGGMKIVWLIFALCAPFLGSLCWFLIGRRRQPIG
ncbi:PLD nuclease N-terminal domain-containing protein [Sciscionella sediminilitoris]|uniref:PLD nuclease N-terminal domain-containing protein n=1 Tax=Sciscionella sediminilitoris TaxID=1445613 RepID=UPI0004DFAD28|nr:PLD nuclease N-terminal domain-containing protein [Sciscionella sp. SE31]